MVIPFLVGHKLDGTEATAAQAVQLVDTKHRHGLAGQLLELNALEVGEANARVDIPADDCVRDIHAHTHHGVLGFGDARLFHEVIDHDLPEVPNVPNFFAL